MNACLPRKKFHLSKPIFLIFLLALITRVLFNIFFVGINDVPVADATDYHQIALNLLNNSTYSSTSRAPLLPFFIAILYKVFGVNYFIVRIFLSIVSSFICLTVYKITRELFNEQIALIAAFISSIYGMMFYWCGFLLTETLCTFFLTLAVLYLVKSSKNPRLRYLVSAGIYLGLASLARPFVFPFFIVLPLWAFVSFKNNLKMASKASLVITLAMFLVILPWIIRNYVVTHKFVFITSQGGQTFLGANNPKVLECFKGGWIHPTESGLFDEKEISHYLKTLSAEDADKLCWKKGIAFVSKKPLFTLKLMVYKFKLFWHLNKDTSFFSLEYFFVLLFAIYGSIRSLEGFASTSILYLLPVFFTLMSLVFWGDDRIRSPIEPLLVIFAAYGIGRVLSEGNYEQRAFS